MSKKYYQPELSEFSKGYKYEVRVYVGAGANQKWEEYIFNPFEDSACTRQVPYELDYIRVKMLDEEDILSLGFEKYDLTSVPNMLHFYFRQMYIKKVQTALHESYQILNVIFEHSHSQFPKVHCFYCDNSDYESVGEYKNWMTAFSLICRNKIELEHFLKNIA